MTVMGDDLDVVARGGTDDPRSGVWLSSTFWSPLPCSAESMS
jgi:hypothetical protein